MTRTCTCNRPECEACSNFIRELEGTEKGRRTLYDRFAGCVTPHLDGPKACVVDDNGNVISVANATGDLTPDMAAITHPDRQNHGYATEALSALAQSLANGGVESVSVHISPNNMASLKLAQKVGAVRQESDNPNDSYKNTGFLRFVKRITGS